jgi:acetylornithine deacetylase/succinyl-diaminopimelate desuccinylase-like protein
MDEKQVAGEVTELLQALIRNKCVNDGTETSGNETRNAETLRAYLEEAELDIELFEKVPGRASIVSRLYGTDPTAPTLLLLGHTDVVPVNEATWTVDPFGGELDDQGRIWGRGAIDMLNLTASMAVAMKQLVTNRQRGDVVFVGVADEEAGGAYGAEFLVDEHRDAVQADFVLTESGGIPMPTPVGPRVYAAVGEKGYVEARLRIKGIAGHASMPYGSDNAIVTAAKVVKALERHELKPNLGPIWREFIEGMGFETELVQLLLDPAHFDEAVQHVPYGLAPRMHACARMTAAPTVMHGGVKSNVIPDSVDLLVNVRTAVGQTEEDVKAYFDDALGDLCDKVDVRLRQYATATESSTDTALWRAMQDVTGKLMPDARCLPTTTAGGTDAYSFRRIGVPAYGFGFFSPKMTTEAFFDMFHGSDEWVDQESLVLSTRLWTELARAL